jgi:NADP-dependent 3-hydroxy acid dehydrogenase YdfG
MTPAGRLDGRTALVAGGSSGIGAATAGMLAGLGARVAVAGRRAELLARVAEDIRLAGGDAAALPVDLARDGAAEECAAAAQAVLGPIDLLVYSAAMVRIGPLHETEPRHWDLMTRLNVTVPFQFARALLPGMRARRYGWIVAVGSYAGLEAVPGTGAYGVTKSALHRLTELVALEGRDHGVRAAAVCPGWVRTGLSADPVGLGVPEEELLSPQDVAAAVAWIVTTPPHVAVGPLVPIAPVSSRADAKSTLTRYAAAREPAGGAVHA